MAGFSATDAALEGFRITRERPKALLAWTLFSLVVSIIGAAITLSLPPEARKALESLSSDETPDAGALLEALAMLSPILLFGLAIQRVMDAAVFRIILKPDDERLEYLRLGADELRLMALRLIYLVLAVVLIALVQFVIALIAFAMSAFGQSAMVFVGSVGELFSIGVLFYVAVRMSLASVITFERRKLSIVESWAATRHKFWPLVGAYLLALCCVIVVAILALVVFSSVAAVVLIATGGSPADLGSIIQPENVTWRTYLNPYVAAYMVVSSLFTAIYYAVIAAPGAYAYRELTGAAPAVPVTAEA